MAQPTPVLTYGATALFLGETPRIVRRGDGFDEGQFEFHLGTESSLLPGAQVPGYGGLFIVEDSITDHSGDLEHSVRAIGLRSGTTRKIASTATDSEDGFDTGSETWIALGGGQRFTYGRGHSDHASLYCVGITTKDSQVDQYKIYDLQFKGIKSRSRPDRYKFGTATREIVIENLLNRFPGGDNTNTHRWSMMKGEPTLEKSYLSTSPPNHSLVGTQSTFQVPMPNAANLQYSASESLLTWQWPNGIVLAAINAEQVPGKSAYFITETYIRRDKITA